MARSGGPSRNVRLFVNDDLAAGAGVELSAAQAHYLEHVLRMARGADIFLFNGRDGEWRASIDSIGRKTCTVLVAEQSRGHQTETDLWLLFAPVKRGSIDFTAAKATELGVSLLWPVLTEYTAVSRVNTDRLRANAVEAAEQCGRVTVPEIREPAPLDRALDRWPAARRILLCDESGAGAPVVDTLKAQRGGNDGTGPWAVLIGPEGGFSRSELDGLRKLPFVISVGLGPRLLRADTAALSALACWQAVVGDWHNTPG